MAKSLFSFCIGAGSFFPYPNIKGKKAVWPSETIIWMHMYSVRIKNYASFCCNYNLTKEVKYQGEISEQLCTALITGLHSKVT